MSQVFQDCSAAVRVAEVAPGCREQPLLMPCGDDTLIGILSTPAPDGADTLFDAPADLAVLVVVGGPQYRVGSHRLFVRLSRHLAAHGITALRFDVRGMGDSTGAQRSFEQLSDDIAAAIDALQRARPAIRRVVLWGLCDAASAALLYCHERCDPRVAGLCLLNPWVRSEATLARTHVKHYYLQRLREPAFWRKLLSGQVAGKAARELWHNLRLARAADKPSSSAGLNGGSSSHPAAEMQLPYVERMALGLQRSTASTLMVLSGQDLTAREFEDVSRSHPVWLAVMGRRDNLLVRRLESADHTFSLPDDARQLFRDCADWLHSNFVGSRSRSSVQSKAAK